MPNWNDILKEIAQVKKKQVSIANERALLAQQATDLVRRKYLLKLHKYSDRNIIAYYSGFLSKPGIEQSDINDEDKNGFMMAVHKLDRRKGLDLFLHTPGGDIAATQSIVHYLHQMFGHNIRAIVPQIAMSAGTMIACSCSEIIMSTHSNLGPIDPHLKGIPAYGVIDEFKRACQEIKDDPSKQPIWLSIIGQYKPTFLGRCENAISWSNSFVQEQLENVMFAKDSDAKGKAAEVVKKLTDFSGNKTHSRHIHFEECNDEIGLTVSKVENDPTLQDLVLTVHHCYMHTLMNTNAFKIIENHLGTALVKNHTDGSKVAPKG